MPEVYKNISEAIDVVHVKKGGKIKAKGCFEEIKQRIMVLNFNQPLTLAK